MQALWMVVGAFLFATMGVGVKVASSSFHSGELVFFRGLVSVLFLLGVLRGGRIGLRTPVPAMHLWRSLIGGIALSAWFYAIGHLPLATAMTLNYMSAIWVATFIVGGALLLGRSERQGPLFLTVLSGFAGVVMTLRPTLEQDQLFAGLIGLMSGLCAALAYLQVAALARAGEPVERTVFYFAIGTTVLGALETVFTGFSSWSAASWPALAWLVPVGILATLGQWCITRAYSQGATLLAANLQYSGIVFSALYSLLLFGDQIPLIGWAGMTLIIASGVAATVLRERALPRPPADDH